MRPLAVCALLACASIAATTQTQVSDREIQNQVRVANIVCKGAIDSGTLSPLLSTLNQTLTKVPDHPDLKKVQQYCVGELNKRLALEDQLLAEAVNDYRRGGMADARTKFTQLATRKTKHVAEAQRFLRSLQGSGNSQDFKDLELAKSYSNVGDLAKAKQILERMIAQKSALVPEATSLLEKIRERERNFSLLQQAFVAFNKRNYSEALELCQRIERSDAKFPQLAYLVGQIQKAMGALPQLVIHVKDKATRQPVAQALCLLKDKIGEGTKGYVLADSRGTCQFANPPIGSYALRVDAMGFRPEEAPLVVGTYPAELAVELQPIKSEAATPAPCQGPLSEAQVASLIKAGVHEVRLRDLFGTCGVAFSIDAAGEQRLRTAGAKDDTIEQLRAWTSLESAQKAYDSKNYEAAYSAIVGVQGTLSDNPQVKALAAKIGSVWSKELLYEARKLGANRENFKDNQSALDKLQMAQRLDGRLAGLMDEMRNVKLALHSMYLQQASDYEAVGGSRAALTYASFLNAKETAPAGEFAFASKLRETGAIFNKKRGVQILLNISNISSGPGGLSDKFSRRVRNVIDRFGLPDIKVRTVDEYVKSPVEDPQFLENRPNGKSPTAVLTVEIVSYDVSTDSKIEDKTSKYISGQEMVPNPRFEKAEAEFRKITAALAGVKPGRKSKEGYSASDQVLAQQTLAATTREIARDKVSEYKYQEISQVMKAIVKINLEIRDQHEKQLIEGRPVEGKKEAQQTEIVNVRDRDTNNLSNRAARMPPSEQLLREAEEATYQKFDDDVAKMVRIYTDRFYLEGEKALRDSRVSDALENFLCHWFFYRGKVEENQARRIRELVKKELGLDLGNVLAVAAGG